ncbi:hypothetical protein LADH09A_000854 [Micromonospora sp. LAH09]|uniref:hypothetical protein n=1 Tax=Micromonospora cabrerizensis TaxID=2911213 RepID=UPI001EE7965D|nr:hypothetical protein [Micromonospora cabrerizensis]MCG5472972.1 hypothetical protein [Micromonospora cabrerizensis]
MAAADRYTGPLAATWPDVGVARLEGLLTSPELALVTAFGPRGALVLSMEELPPHEAFLGGAP